jgi:general secretion pathway protein I
MSVSKDRGVCAFSGFTLLEVMVAIAIIAIVVLSIYRLHTQTISMNTAARFYTIAPLLAEDTLAAIEIQKADQWQADGGDFGEKFTGFHWQTQIDAVESELLDVQAERLKKIEVTISFNHDEYVYHLRTYRFIEAF